MNKRERILVTSSVLVVVWYLWDHVRAPSEDVGAASAQLLVDEMTGDGSSMARYMPEQDLKANPDLKEELPWILSEVRGSMSMNRPYGAYKVEADTLTGLAASADPTMVRPDKTLCAYSIDLYRLPDGNLKGPILYRLIDAWVNAKFGERYPDLQRNMRICRVRMDGYREARKVFEPLGVHGFTMDALYGRFQTWDEVEAYYTDGFEKARRSREREITDGGGLAKPG